MILRQREMNYRCPHCTELEHKRPQSSSLQCNNFSKATYTSIKPLLLIVPLLKILLASIIFNLLHRVSCFFLLLHSSSCLAPWISDVLLSLPSIFSQGIQGLQACATLPMNLYGFWASKFRSAFYQALQYSILIKGGWDSFRS